MCWLKITPERLLDHKLALEYPAANCYRMAETGAFVCQRWAVARLVSGGASAREEKSGRSHPLGRFVGRLSPHMLRRHRIDPIAGLTKPRADDARFQDVSLDGGLKPKEMLGKKLPPPSVSCRSSLGLDAIRHFYNVAQRINPQSNRETGSARTIPSKTAISSRLGAMAVLLVPLVRSRLSNTTLEAMRG